jgi:hypothetical protein
MTQKQILKKKIAYQRKQLKRASTWTEKCMIENMIEFLEREQKFLGASS